MNKHIIFDKDLNSPIIELDNLKSNKVNKKSFFKLFLIGVVIGFINGFWGGGGGMICVPTLENFVKLPEKVAHATTILIMFPLCLSSVIVYYLFGTLKYSNMWLILMGFVGGGVVGAILLKNINNVILKLIFSVIIIAGGIKLIVQ